MPPGALFLNLTSFDVFKKKKKKKEEERGTESGLLGEEVVTRGTPTKFPSSEDTSQVVGLVVVGGSRDARI